MRLSSDILVSQYRRLTDLVHAHGVPIVAQLALGAYYRDLPDGRLMQVEPDEDGIIKERESRRET